MYPMNEITYLAEMQSSLAIAAIAIAILAIAILIGKHQTRIDMERYEHYRRIVRHNRIIRKYR